MKCIYCGSKRVIEDKFSENYHCKKCDEVFDEEDIKFTSVEKGKKDRGKRKFTGNGER